MGITSDQTAVVSAGFDNTLKLWDVRTGRERSTLTGHVHWVHGVRLSPDGGRAISWSWDHSVCTWDLAHGRMLQRFTGPTSFICAGAWSSDGVLLVAGTQDGRLWFWERQTSTPATSFPAHADVVAALAILPGDQRIVSGGRDGLLKLWDLSRLDQYRRSFAELPRSRDAIIRDPGDASALRTFGDWYAFRGEYGWAAEFLEKARTAGAEVSSLALGRCYWQLDRREAAAREFRRATERHEAPSDYLNLCIRAVTDTPR